ncbi:MAG: methionyl-tRNA formyltransferase [Rubrivivax sp.]|nr:methionyl-tRNA formyltransferase [Rubrivivax sp.]
MTRVAFAGTPEFAACALRALHGAGHGVPLVLTQPDRPGGRGMQLQASPVKQYAQAQGLAVAQPRSLRLDGRYPDDAAAARQALEDAAPDVMVVAAYGLILPPWALSLPRWGCLNIHASLLPRWRGAAPIHRAIEAGDEVTGITIMQMDAGLDTGPVLLSAPEPIRPDDSTGSLHDRLAAQGARLILQAMADAAAGRLQPSPQPAQGATYALKVDKAEAAIDWRRPAAEIERRVRAFDPFPGAHFGLAGQRVKLWQARLAAGEGVPGAVLPSPAGECVVACGQGALALQTVQRAGGRRQPVAAFLQSWPLAPGTRLG